jgi:hypothetical protein
VLLQVNLVLGVCSLGLELLPAPPPVKVRLLLVTFETCSILAICMG